LTPDTHWKFSLPAFLAGAMGGPVTYGRQGNYCDASRNTRENLQKGAEKEIGEVSLIIFRGSLAKAPSFIQAVDPVPKRNVEFVKIKNLTPMRNKEEKWNQMK